MLDKEYRYADTVRVKTSDAINFYGTQAALADALDMAQPTISGWGEEPPDLRQIQLERITKGKLKANPACYLPKPKVAEAASARRA